jgi:hypothetical protein
MPVSQHYPDPYELGESVQLGPMAESNVEGRPIVRHAAREERVFSLTPR